MIKKIKIVRNRFSTFLLAGLMLCLVVTIGSCDDDEAQEECDACVLNVKGCSANPGTYSCPGDLFCYEDKSDCIKGSDCCN